MRYLLLFGFSFFVLYSFTTLFFHSTNNGHIFLCPCVLGQHNGCVELSVLLDKGVAKKKGISYSICHLLRTLALVELVLASNRILLPEVESRTLIKLNLYLSKEELEYIYVVLQQQE
jgi:hypothetical protein